MTTEFVFWDHDGVIVDTEPLFFEATRITLDELGFELSREHWLSCQARGLGLAKVVSDHVAVTVDLAEVRRIRDDRYDDLLENNDVLIDGALEVLEQVAEQHRMALVTTSLRRFIDQLHARSNVLDYFDCVITAEDCSEHKPNPEPYLRAMTALSASPSNSVAVEDSSRGLAAALNADLRCYVVRSHFMKDTEFPGALAVLDHIQDLPTLLTPDA